MLNGNTTKNYIMQIYCAGVTMFFSTNRNTCFFFSHFMIIKCIILEMVFLFYLNRVAKHFMQGFGMSRA